MGALSRPRLLAVLNLTPDSFSDGGAHATPGAAVEFAYRMAEEGADALDVGAESTRPGSPPLSLAEELARLDPVFERLGRGFPIPISIDTRRARAAALASDHGATILNDTSALRDDPELAQVAAERRMQVVLMHRKGTPETMQLDPHYDDVVAEVRAFFEERVAHAVRAGIARDRIILDPGLGFGKRVEDNSVLVARLADLRVGGLPILVGASRTSFVARFDRSPPRERLAGSLAFAAAARAAGANWLRVHDVRETRAFLATLDALDAAEGHAG